jgi:hypothetical protein
MQVHPSHGHVPAYRRSDFSQSIDRSRPRTLLTKNTIRSGSLEYLYTDTGESATVPNIWYNQTVEANVERLRWHATQYDERVRQLIENPPIGSTKEGVRRDIRLHRARAVIAREAAAKLEREQETFFYQVSEYISVRNPA